MTRWVLAFAVGCSEYDLETKADPEAPPEETTPPETTPAEDPPVQDPPAEDPVGCEAVGLTDWSWVSQPPFAEQADPVDGLGIPFWDPAADRSSWAPVALPSLDIPIGMDRVYAATFELAAMPPLLEVDLQSDDGVWLWVNGTEVGHWGGDWQQEGCVNENANCQITLDIEPVDLTPFVVAGSNTIAARVSNPVLNSYYDVLPSCVDVE